MEIKATGIYKAYGTVSVLKNISFVIEIGQKIGLVGNNGTGKSTLLKILAGIIDPDEGNIEIRNNLKLGYMPQDTSLVTDETVADYLRRITGIGRLEEEMGNSQEALVEYDRRDGYTFDHRMNIILMGFGLREKICFDPINTLSSGQKSKILLSGILLSDVDLLLLDEPTNNLDLPALIWLEDFIAKSSAGCLVVSHDRLFLDRVVNKIFEIDWRKREINITNGKYSDYIERIRKEKERQLSAHEAQQEEIRRLKETARSKRSEMSHGSRYTGSDNDKFARGFKRDQAARSGKTAKAIEKRIEKMPVIEKPFIRDALRIDLKPSVPGGTRDIELDNVVAGYSLDGFKVDPISLSIPYGSRVVILGLNGSGKSTLLKTISREIEPLSGAVRIGGSLIIGNLMQEHDNLPREETLFSFLTERGGIGIQDAYNIASKFGFDASEVDKKIESISPGGRSRLLLSLFSALSVNVLLLDEPTNHLDLEALSALEEVIEHYEGTIILISHDRYFLERFKPTDIYLLSDKKLMVQKYLQEYLDDAENKAKRLIEML